MTSERGGFASRFKVRDKHDLWLDVLLNEDEWFDHHRAFTSKSVIRVQRVQVHAVVQNGALYQGIGSKDTYRVTYYGPRVIKAGLSDRIESCDYWHNDLMPLPLGLREQIEAAVEEWADRYITTEAASDV